MLLEPVTEKLRVFVGDVHGCSDELHDLLDKLRFDPATHALHFVGDLVNRGPKSLQALRTAIELSASSVLGNHDLHLIGRARGTRQSKALDTLDEVLEAPDAADLIAWLCDRPAIMAWTDLVLVHAGLHPRWSDVEAVATQVASTIDWSRDPFAHPELCYCATVRHCDADGGRPAKAVDGGLDPPAPYAPWDRWYRGGWTVVFGHWAQRGLVTSDRIRGLDSGCVWGGRLTAWVAEQDRFVSVPARRCYQRPD